MQRIVGSIEIKGIALRELLILVTLGLGLVGCQTFNVQSDWDPGIAFLELEQYAWVEPPPVEGANPFADNSLLRKRVRLAIETALAERGYVAVAAPEDADFLVTYDVILEERLRVDSFSTTPGLYHGHRRFYGIGGGYARTNVSAYQESTLLLDFLDPESKEIVWRGWSSGIVRTRDRGRGEAHLNRGVRAILERFPPSITPDGP